MSRSPRPYQIQCVKAVTGALDRNIMRPLYVACTGSGKTVMAGYIYKELRGMGYKRMLVLAHTYELVEEQWVPSLREQFPDLTIEPETAEHKAWPDADIVCGMVQTVVNPRRLHNQHFDIIFCDEAHHAIRNSRYDKIIHRLKPRIVIGCTATPKRLGREAIHSAKGAIFDEVVFNYPLKQAHAEGWVVGLEYHVVRGVEMGKLSSMAGDFNEQELAFKVIDRKRTEAALQKWEEFAISEKTAGFCVNIAHAKYTCDVWNLAGYSADYIHGNTKTMSKDERKDRISEFRKGNIQCMFNCQVMTEGLDVPDIGCVSLLRPTMSHSLYMQMIGRGTRPSPGKTKLIVIDIADIYTKGLSPVNLPTVLDLPYNFDAQGQELFKAAKEADKIAAAVKATPPKTYQELMVMSEQLNILSALQTPEEIMSFTNLKWLRTEAGYVLYVNKGRLELTDDALGDWHFKGMENNKFKAGGGLKQAFAQVDEYVRSAYKEQINLLDRRVNWNKHKATEKQIALLRKMKIPEHVIAELDKGKAAGVISQKMSKGTRE